MLLPRIYLFLPVAKLYSRQRLCYLEMKLCTMKVTPVSLHEESCIGMISLQKASTQKSGKAMFRLGMLYQRELNDKQKSLHWCKLAADNGDGQAQKFMARAYEIGNGVRKDIDKAFCCYYQSACSGDIESQLWLANVYEGNSVYPPQI